MSAKTITIRKKLPEGSSISECTTAERSNYSYLGKTIEDTYQNKELRDHIYSTPDIYLGSIEPIKERIWVYDESGRMVLEEVTFIEAFLKIYDEVLVNAIDQHHRIKLLKSQSQHQHEMASLHSVTRIDVTINETLGSVEVRNNGEGLDVAIHEGFQCYVPQMIFSNLLTGTNYAEGEERTVGGRHGVGAKLCNIFSTQFEVETVDSRRKLKYVQRFRDNMKIIEPPVITPYKGVPYTSIRYIPEFRRFGISTEQIPTIGDWKLLKKRAYDAAACTDQTVSVYLNGQKIITKTFEDYINLYIGKKSETKRVHEIINDRWEVGVCLSPDGEPIQVSFVNGICTDHGGRHVNHIVDNLTRKIIEAMGEKTTKSLDIKPDFIKKNLFVFINATIVNPSFDTQTKRRLTTLVKDFGSRCELSDDFVKAVIKLGIMDRAKKLAEFKAKEKLSIKTDGSRGGRVYHAKLVDATAVSKSPSKCTIVFTEGDSAASFMAKGIKGIPDNEHQFWGWFPLRGKLLNVRGATIKQLQDNEEIMMIKKIIGLKDKCDYSKGISNLRYGRVMILADADDDGHHIKGLIMNFIGHYWPALIQRSGFICDIATPIVKAFRKKGKKKEEKAFFTLKDYHKWMEEGQCEKSQSGWHSKYYKGLATYEPPEARQLMKAMKVVSYWWDRTPIEFKGITKDASDHKFELAFAKKFEDDRKQWLNNELLDVTLTNGTVTNGTDINISYNYFIENYLKQFSLADNVRSIPSLFDGFKPSQRKVLYAAIKKKLYRDDVRVTEFGGSVSEQTAYHHGEASLYGTIIGMAQDYVGSNNINLLYPAGTFGSRMGGGSKNKKGEDNGAPRYICTYLSSPTELLFKKEDATLLTPIYDDGRPIEPEYYMPILPMILVNGAIGIGTGYSTSVSSYNPEDIIANIRIYLRHDVAKSDTGESCVGRLKDITFAEMHPWHRGYHGKIMHLGGQKYITVGEYYRTNENTIRVTELPVGTKNCMSYKQYVEFLNTLLTEEVAKQHGIKTEKRKRKIEEDDNEISTKSTSFNQGVISDYVIVKNTDTDFIVDITFDKDVLERELTDNNNYRFEKKMKLAFAFSNTNMHLYNKDNKIQLYNSPLDILQEFCDVRYIFYEKRRKLLLDESERDRVIADARYRFVTEIMNDTLDIKRKTKSQIIDLLEQNNYPKISKSNNRAESDEIANQFDSGNYSYLLNMPINSFSLEMLERLKKEADRLVETIGKLTTSTAGDLWIADLDAFLTVYREDQEEWRSRNEIREQRKKISIVRSV